MLIKVLLTGKKDCTPELSAAQLLPVLINPARAFLEKAGDLLGGHYAGLGRFVNGGLKHCHPSVLRYHLLSFLITITLSSDIAIRIAIFIDV
jgi:hypothetical protein